MFLTYIYRIIPLYTSIQNEKVYGNVIYSSRTCVSAERYGLTIDSVIPSLRSSTGALGGVCHINQMPNHYIKTGQRSAHKAMRRLPEDR